jgi:hypothetical protein
MVTTLIPPLKRGGGAARLICAKLVEAMLYIAASECARQLLPNAFRRIRRCGAASTQGATPAFFDTINIASAMSLCEVEEHAGIAQRPVSSMTSR